MNLLAQTPGQARYLNGKQVTTVATDYGDYAASFQVPQLRVAPRGAS